MDVLHKFANHTRQSYDEAKDVSKLAQKWLAVHTTLVQAPLVYAHIASDYALLNLRTHSPPLSHYARAGMDVDAFVYCVKNGLKSNKPIDAKAAPVFAQFCDSLFPKPVGEEAWEKYERSDHWKKAAYFLALNASQPSHFYPMVEAIYFEDRPLIARASRAEKDEVADLFTRINRFSRMPAPVEIASLISQISIEHNVIVNKTIDAKATATTSSDSEEAEGPLIIAEAEQDQLQLAVSKVESKQTWNDIRKDAFIQDYRKRAGLSATVPPQKLVKQMVLSLLGFKGTEPVCASLLLQHQDEFVQVTPDAWPTLAAALMCFEKDPVKLLDAKRPALVAYAQLASSLDSRVFLNDVLTLYHNQQQLASISDRPSIKYLKAFPRVDECIINTLVNL